MASFLLLRRRGFDPFTSFYLGFLAAMGGGWLFEVPNWVAVGNWAAFAKINAAKVFLVDFQVLCLPILVFIIATSKRWRPTPLMVPLTLLCLVWFWWHPELKPLTRGLLGRGSFKWLTRLPAAALLLAGIYGIKGEKN